MHSQASLLRLSPLFLFFVSSMPRNVALAGQCCSGEDNGTPECTTDGINDNGDQTPANNAAKIGYELEAGRIRLAPEKDGCTEAQTDQAKGHLLAGRKGKNWMLTADTLVSAIPYQQVDPEYILDGQNIKLGTPDLQNAANAAAADFVSSISCRKQHLGSLSDSL